VEEKQMIPYPKGFLRWVLLFPVHVYRSGLGDVLKFFNIMILGVCGRNSGLPRYVPIEFRRHGTKLYVVSGWGERPQWFRNLQANPYATIQMGSQTQRVRARLVDDRGEALRVLNLFRRPATVVYDVLLAPLNTGSLDLKSLPDISHQFTIMRLDIEGGDLPVPPMHRDLAWVIPGTMLAGIALMSLRLLRQRN
jgi:deazaflavin-dependent oxidoreductase (nitroreductase family)